MDLLVLADSDGVVDMTLEAISRRTNVPIAEVSKYINELQQPDPTSRSKMEEGKRLVSIDSQRGWGWQIVNYAHYRSIKDEEARRSYFRDAKRKQRGTKARKKICQRQKLDTNGQVLTSASPSSSVSSCTKKEIEEYCTSIGLPASDGEAMFFHWQEKGWAKIKDWKLTIQKWKSFGYLPSQKQRTGKQEQQMSYQQRQARINKLNERKKEINRSLKDPLAPPSWAEKELGKIESELLKL